MPTRSEIENTIKALLVRYNAIDVVVFGGKNFKKSNIFAFAEELREMLGKNADVFEISEVNKGTPFYDTLMKEGVKIA